MGNSPFESVSSWYSATVRFPVFFPPPDADTLKLKIKHAAHATGGQAEADVRDVAMLW